MSRKNLIKKIMLFYIFICYKKCLSVLLTTTVFTIFSKNNILQINNKLIEIAKHFFFQNSNCKNMNVSQKSLMLVFLNFEYSLGRSNTSYYQIKK